MINTTGMCMAKNHCHENLRTLDLQYPKGMFMRSTRMLNRISFVIIRQINLNFV